MDKTKPKLKQDEEEIRKNMVDLAIAYEKDGKDGVKRLLQKISEKQKSAPPLPRAN